MDKFLINKLSKISIQDILKIFAEKKYFYHTKKINLVGIRNIFKGAVKTESFKDALLIFYKSGNDWNIQVFPMSTDFKISCMTKLLNKKGVPILKPGQYEDMFCLKELPTKEFILYQQNEAIVYRDKNKNDYLNFDKNTLQRENSKLCLFYNTNNQKDLDRISPGSQILENKIDNLLLTSICKKSSYEYGDLFTYTLLLSEDFS